jgi:DNA-binding NtrC family response regulator
MVAVGAAGVTVAELSVIRSSCSSSASPQLATASGSPTASPSASGPNSNASPSSACGGLLEQDRISRSDPVQTLAALCANGGHRKETARSLHVERQTLYHRLKRIEATVGDLSDASAGLEPATQGGVRNSNPRGPLHLTSPHPGWLG